MGYKLEDINLEIISDFIETGNRSNVDPVILEYLDLMDKVRGMFLRFDKFGSRDHIINHLMKVDGFSRFLASNIYNDALEYFYCDSKISKDAWRNIYAEKMEKVINLAMLAIKDTSDASKVTKMIAEVATLRQLHVEDKEELPEEWFAKPWKLYAMDAEMLGMPTVNRHKIAEQIDNLPELSEKEREMIKREAGALPIKIFIDGSEDARKS